MGACVGGGVGAGVVGACVGGAEAGVGVAAWQNLYSGHLLQLRRSCLKLEVL